MDKFEIIANLVKEALDMPSGWQKEVYYDNGELTFSSPMTRNSWTRDPSKVGVIQSLNSKDDLEVICEQAYDEMWYDEIIGEIAGYD